MTPTTAGRRDRSVMQPASPRPILSAGRWLALNPRSAGAHAAESAERVPGLWLESLFESAPGRVLFGVDRGASDAAPVSRPALDEAMGALAILSVLRSASVGIVFARRVTEVLDSASGATAVSS